MTFLLVLPPMSAFQDLAVVRERYRPMTADVREALLCSLVGWCVRILRKTQLNFDVGFPDIFEADIRPQ